MKRVHVAAAVIRGEDGRILIAKRPDDKHQGGLWEFPGGKVEEGEAVQVALSRELHEELGITVEAARMTTLRLAAHIHTACSDDSDWGLRRLVRILRRSGLWRWRRWPW